MTDWKIRQKIWDNSIIIGSNLKAIRGNAGVSQEMLSQHLDISFQQIQKYEKGQNRISASSLYEISKILNCDVREFFIGISNDDLETDKPINELVKNTEAFKVAIKLNKLTNSQLKAVSQIIDQIA